MELKDNLQPSSGYVKRAPGMIFGILELIEEVDLEKHRWKIKCTKCGAEYELSNSTITNYAKGEYTKCKYCPTERVSKYKIGDIYGGVKITGYYKKDDFILECLNCGKQFQASRATLLKYVNIKEGEYQYCKYCKPEIHKSKKYKAGEILGNCYELIRPLGNNTWLVKCTKCGKEQEQAIPNIKKHKKETCFYCEHPYSEKAAFNRTRLSQMSIDERIYTYYKNKIENDNNRPGAKYKTFELNLQEYSNLIHSDCYYCGAKPTDDNIWNKSGKRKCDTETIFINGVDRIDSDKGYTIDNCVPCCPTCNRIKSDLPQDVFYNQIKKIYLKRFNDQSIDVASSESEMEDSF